MVPVFCSLCVNDGLSKWNCGKLLEGIVEIEMGLFVDISKWQD